MFQTHKRFKRTLLGKKHNLKIVGVIPFTKLRNSKRSLKRCVYRFFLKEERGGKLRTKIVGRVQVLACLNMEISVFSRFKVSFGDFRQFFTAGPKSSRGLVSVKQF